ncbi:hypothetical protein NG895_09590 [Aeoliella sp. ICT_H6.2]|uniref:Uncharacterized protein n=1 Tax=Aeoliella straminimaris TaxID=2954799 RepID=A0A9X2JIP5_9BACT|nr:hypothetical protein [Aeoliella straminimaris]MCO6044159.1 hypothetical protein [Aeoliella straminimaris]
MFIPDSSQHDEVDSLLRNARLRDELEPLFDESIGSVDYRSMPTHRENEFLESMLEWERAPMVPISQWFDPELLLPHPDHLSQDDLSGLLCSVVEQLYQQYIVLDFTNHLDDRQLYTLIYRDILPSYEKKLAKRRSFLHWDCANIEGDPSIWLRYYASDEERDVWAGETGEPLPPREVPPHARQLPRGPM